MKDKQDHIKLTATEVSYLWNSYMADSMAVCVLKYFLENIDDQDIKNLVNHALDMSQQHIEIIKGIFSDEGIPVPQGFTEKDVNLKAKRLFSDKFYLYYIKNMAKGGLTTNATVTPNIYRNDILSFCSKALTSSLELNNESIQLLLEKGLAIRPPTIPYPQKVEFVHKQSFVLEALGRREALTGAEVTNLYSNIQTNQLGSSLSIAFSQVAQSDKVRNYVLRGKDIALKHIKVFSSYLEMNSLPIPMSFDQEVANSTESPFSDKLMLFHYGLMIYSGIGNYGVSISESRRSDLVVDYSRLTAEILKYSEDCINIMIANEWLEQPPLAANRKDLAKD
ncbi:DUF3231 family protein [Metabacillus fastidiosus]|uniref:DUF3231 family protein n=1 Tax=Metabacillus fastidiosus TaxID=1458 RepID=UPI002DC04986|nr:DUF3231 family protein [Metabacillus fastidiosus]MEC2074521.1 DUF3231 family protein [Metabacillus fastidiosus]